MDGLTNHPNVKASTSDYGHVKVISNNGLSVSNGVISMSKGNASSYGATKLSDTYNSSISGGNAVGGLGASQNALYNAYNALNTNINNFGNQTTIINDRTDLSVGQVISTTNDARKYDFFIVSLCWHPSALVRKRYYNSTHDIVEGATTICDTDIGVLRYAEFLINRSTGEITLNKCNQTNLQASGTWYLECPNQGVGLYGITL